MLNGVIWLLSVIRRATLRVGGCFNPATNLQKTEEQNGWLAGTFNEMHITFPSYVSDGKPNENITRTALTGSEGGRIR